MRKLGFMVVTSSAPPNLDCAWCYLNARKVQKMVHPIFGLY